MTPDKTTKFLNSGWLSFIIMFLTVIYAGIYCQSKQMAYYQRELIQKKRIVEVTRLRCFFACMNNIDPDLIPSGLHSTEQTLDKYIKEVIVLGEQGKINISPENLQYLRFMIGDRKWLAANIRKDDVQ